MCQETKNSLHRCQCPHLQIIARLLLVKRYDNKMFKTSFNCVIFLLTQPQVANQQQKKNFLGRYFERGLPSITAQYLLLEE